MRFLDQWQKVVHARNVEKGFYDYQQDVRTLDCALNMHDVETSPTVVLFATEIDALKRVLVDYNKAQIERKLLLVIGELCEAHEELRSGRAPTDVYFNPDKPMKPEGFGIEGADAAIRLLDIMESCGIDLNDLMERKHAYNGTREYKHGRQF